MVFQHKNLTNQHSCGLCVFFPTELNAIYSRMLKNVLIRDCVSIIFVLYIYSYSTYFEFAFLMFSVFYIN